MKISGRTLTILDIPLSDTERLVAIAAIILGCVVLLALPSLGRWGMALVGGLR